MAPIPQYPPKDQWPNDPYCQATHTMAEAATELKLWDFFMTYEPPEGSGFAQSTHPNVLAIKNHKAVDNDGHSYCSFAIAMRGLSYLAKHGWDKYYEKCTSE